MHFVKSVLIVAGAAAIGVIVYIGKDYSEQFDDSMASDSSKDGFFG
jgi:hypothetical protein